MSLGLCTCSNPSTGAAHTLNIRRHGGRVPLLHAGGGASTTSLGTGWRKSSPLDRQRQVAVHMGLRAVETFDGHVTLEQAAEEALVKLLTSATFCKQVATQTQQPAGVEVEFAGHLFQPTPWSPATRKGMPQEYEQYLEDPAYAVINVPPNFMFNAKIFKPSRLCAIYKRVAST